VELAPCLDRRVRQQIVAALLDRACVGVRLGGAGVSRASTAADVVSATTLPPSMVSNAEQPASVLGR